MVEMLKKLAFRPNSIVTRYVLHNLFLSLEVISISTKKLNIDAVSTVAIIIVITTI